MLPETKAKLERILALGPNQLSDSEVSYLRARRSYLTPEQITLFAHCFRGLPKTGTPVEPVVEPKVITKNENITNVKKPANEDKAKAPKAETTRSKVNSIVEPEVKTPEPVKTIGDDASQYDPDYQG